MTPFIVDAHSLTQFQACKRRALLARDWLPPRWRPRSLFHRCLRRAIATLSDAGPCASAANVAKIARAEFYTAAASPGLDLPGDEVYAAAKEWSALLDTIIRSVARLSLLMLRPVPDAPLGDSDLRWHSLALGRDDSGTLHRWTTVERWDDATTTREMHGWPVIGDIAVAAAPLQLHVVVVGPMRDGHHYSAWGRRFRHPYMPSLKGRWRSPTGKPLSREWKPEFLADLSGPEASPDDWVDLMWEQGAAQGLLHHPIVECPSAATVADVRRQITMEAKAIKDAAGTRWGDWPMSRGACDWIGGRCAYQPCCHREGVAVDVDVAALGYVRRPEVSQPRQQPLLRPRMSAESPRSEPPAPRPVPSAAHP